MLKVLLSKRAAPAGVTRRQSGMRALRHLQVDLGRLLVCRSGFGQISPKMRMPDLIEPLRQGHQNVVTLTGEQILEKRDGAGARHRVPEGRDGRTHLLGDLMIRRLQIVPARIQKTGGCERHRISQTDIIQQDHRRTARCR